MVGWTGLEQGANALQGNNKYTQGLSTDTVRSGGDIRLNFLTMSIFPTFVSPGVDTVDPAGHSRNHVINVNMVGHGPGAAYEDAAWVP